MSVRHLPVLLITPTSYSKFQHRHHNSYVVRPSAKRRTTMFGGSMRAVVLVASSFLLQWTCLLCLFLPDRASSFSNVFRRGSQHGSNKLLSALTSRKATRISNTVLGPPRETKPDYENIHGPLGKSVDNLFMKIFREQLAYHLGFDSDLPKVSE